MSLSIPITLASSSPRRRQLLQLLGLSFTVCAADVDERIWPGEHPTALARRLSAAKAEAVVYQADGLIIAADTLVVLGESILGKPADEAEAWEMLTRLRNCRHEVYTGLTLVDARTRRRCTQVAMTPVLMRDYSDAEIRHYIASGDPLDKAGAYAIQYAGFDPVARIEGCYANVMGLPLCHLYRSLDDWEIPVPIHPLGCCPLAITEGCPWSTEITSAPPNAWCLEGDRAC